MSRLRKLINSAVIETCFGSGVLLFFTPMNNHVQYICDVESYKRLGYNNVLFNILFA